MHTHACTRTQPCTSACTRTHSPTPTRSPSITAAAPAASFVLPLRPGRARAVPSEPRRSSRRHRPLPARAGGDTGDRAGGGTACPGGTGCGAGLPRGPIRSHATGPADATAPPRAGGERGLAGPFPACRRLRPRHGPRKGRVPRCRSMGFRSPLSPGTPSSRGAGSGRAPLPSTDPAMALTKTRVTQGDVTPSRGAQPRPAHVPRAPAAPRAPEGSEAASSSSVRCGSAGALFPAQRTPRYRIVSHHPARGAGREPPPSPAS